MGRKIELERRIELLQGEREGLSSTLDESADRIIMLEKQTREQDSLVSWMIFDCEECSRAPRNYFEDDYGLFIFLFFLWKKP